MKEGCCVLSERRFADTGSEYEDFAVNAATQAIGDIPVKPGHPSP
jgi:hypothetical protein